jgi:putative peptidoglycan lipid II flippase
METRPGGYAGFRNVDTAEREVQARRKLMTAVLVGAAVMFVIAVASLGMSINRMLGGPEDIAINADRLGLSPTTADSAPAPPVAREAAAAGAPITPASAAVFSPDGSPDNPGAAGQAVDGDPATAWATDRYFDADPFPAFKQGVGLLLEMPRPAKLAALTIDVNGSGTVVEIRSADGQPGSVADTKKLVDATTLKPGSNRIPVSSDAQVSTVLVWITKLGSTNGDNVAEISEVKAFTTAPA